MDDFKFMNNWDDEYFNMYDLYCTVSVVHFYAYKNEEIEGDELANPPTNHWVTYLQVVSGSEERSVSIDMVPGYGDDGQRGKIHISSKSYISTINAIKTLSLPVLGIVTLQSILELVVSKGREKYQFTEGEGCRFWVSVIAGDFRVYGDN